MKKILLFSFLIVFTMSNYWSFAQDSKKTTQS